MERRIPETLLEAFRQQRGALFVGAGASCAAGLPDWNSIVQEYAQRLNTLKRPKRAEFTSEELIIIPQYYLNNNTPRDFFRILEHQLRGSSTPNTKVQRAICHVPARLIYTTNFDTLIEDEFKKLGRDIKIVENESKARQERGGTKSDVEVRKIHGTITDHDSIIFTREHYAKFSLARPIMIEDLKFHLRTYNFLFIGYSLRDPDFSSIFDGIYYQMQGFHLNHFICLDSVSELEKQDLRLRWLTAISLEAWGSNPPERLLSFLEQFADETSKLHHIQNFFSVKKGGIIPIILTAFEQKKERYFSFPACDVNAAYQIARDLLSAGAESEIFPDVEITRRTNNMIQSHPVFQGDVVLVCSPFGNLVTREYFRIMWDNPKLRQKSGVAHKFEKAGGSRRIVGQGGQVFLSSDLPIANEGILSDCGQKSDYALVARYINPWSQGNETRYIFVFAGIQAIGTHLLGDYLKTPKGYQHICQGLQARLPHSVVVKVPYNKYNPMRFTWSEEPIVIY